MDSGPKTSSGVRSASSGIQKRVHFEGKLQSAGN
jgi:hypothetical protein